jgi:hypothetical protein
MVIALGCGKRAETPAEPDPSPNPVADTPRTPVTPPAPDPKPVEPKPAPREKPSPIRFHPQDAPPLSSQVPVTYSLEAPPVRHVGLKDKRRLSLDTAATITTVYPLRDGTVLVGTLAGEFLRWNVATDRLVAKFDLKVSQIETIVATPDETTAVVDSRASGGNLVASDLASGKQLWRVHNRYGFGRPSFSFDGARVYVAVGQEGKVFDTRTGRELPGRAKHPDQFQVWRAYPDNVHVLMALDLDHRVPAALAVLNPEQPDQGRKPLVRYHDKKHIWVTRACEFSPDGRLLAWGGTDTNLLHTLFVLDAETGAVLCNLRLTAPPSEVSFSRDRLLLAWRDSLQSGRHVAHVFDLTVKKEVLRIEVPQAEVHTHLGTVSFAADNTVLLVSDKTLIACPPVR